MHVALAIELRADTIAFGKRLRPFLGDEFSQATQRILRRGFVHRRERSVAERRLSYVQDFEQVEEDVAKVGLVMLGG